MNKPLVTNQSLNGIQNPQGTPSSIFTTPQQTQQVQQPLSPIQLEAILRQSLVTAGLTEDEQKIFIDSEIHKKPIWQVICEIKVSQQDIALLTSQINALYDSAVTKVRSIIPKG